MSTSRADRTWRVSLDTRRDLLDTLAAEGVVWSGRLDEDAFLGRIWDLSRLPSNDYRFKDAAGDIHQHRVNNPGDWDDDWIYSDTRFDLVHTEDQRFLKFLCQTVHPVIRPDADEARQLVDLYNGYLRRRRPSRRRRPARQPFGV